MCLGTIVSGHNRVWAQSCLGTIVSGRSRVWAQSCLGTVVSGHNRVWAQSSGLNHDCMGTNVVEPKFIGKYFHDPFLFYFEILAKLN